MKTKVLLGIFISFLSTALTACDAPNDVKEMVGFEQSAFLWIRSGTEFSLDGIRYQNHETLKAKLNQDMSLDLTNQQGKTVHIPFPKDLFKRNGQLISQSETHTGFNTALARLTQPQRQWTKVRSTDTPMYMTTINSDGTISQTYMGSTTDYYTDFYMDGYIEYRLAFYPVRSTIVKEPDAVLFIKKPVKNFLMETRNQKH